MFEALEYVKIRLMGMAKTERGASAVEYGLLVSLIAIAIIAAVFLLGWQAVGRLHQDEHQPHLLISAGRPSRRATDVAAFCHIPRESSMPRRSRAELARSHVRRVRLAHRADRHRDRRRRTPCGNGTAGLFKRSCDSFSQHSEGHDLLT